MNYIKGIQHNLTFLILIQQTLINCSINYEQKLRIFIKNYTLLYIKLRFLSERIKSALSSINFQFPAQKITINLSPSDLKKEGSHFDLVIALLIAIQKERFTCDDFFIFGELGLDGKVKKTNAIFPIILSLASHTPNLRVVVPNELLAKVHQIPHIEAYGVETLNDALLFFKEKRFNSEVSPREQTFCENILELKNKRYFYNTQFPLDFSDVLGQHRAKRAMLIAAAGMHNLLMEGSPGCGKSMSIKRLRYILPPQSIEEILESNAYQSLQEEDVELNPLRPFRSPHHTSSRPSIFGGGCHFQLKVLHSNKICYKNKEPSYGS